MPGLLTPLAGACRTLCRQQEPRCFVRLAHWHSALFVCDAPRLLAPAGLGRVQEALAEKGFVCWVEADRELLSIDLPMDGYEELLVPLPLEPGPLPAREALHGLYALCRLLLLHPAPLSAQPLAPLRQVLKIVEQQEAESPAVLREMTVLHEQCALWLRGGLPLPHGAGRVLSVWLQGTTP